MAASDRRGLSPLDGDDGVLASQPTFSRLLGALAAPENLSVLEDAIFDSAARSVHAMNGGEKLEPITPDIDSFPHRVHGHQPGSEHNKYYRAGCFHPLGVMLGETGHWLAHHAAILQTEGVSFRLREARARKDERGLEK